jgi:hypothetical protein
MNNLIHKCNKQYINRECPVYLQDLITIKNSSYSFRYQNKTVIPQVRTTHLRFAVLKICRSKALE